MVNLGERSYPIHFGADLSGRIVGDRQTVLGAGRKFAVVTDGHLLE